MPTRAKTDTVQFKLRMPEALRARLEKRARANKVSINTEINRRLDASFNAEFFETIHKQNIQEMRDEWARERDELLDEIRPLLALRGELKKKEPA